MGSNLANVIQPFQALYPQDSQSTKPSVLHIQYTQTLEAVDHQPYLGVTLSESLNWKEHTLHVKNKATVISR